MTPSEKILTLLSQSHAGLVQAELVAAQNGMVKVKFELVIGIS